MQITTAADHNVRLLKNSYNPDKEYDSLIIRIESHIRDSKMHRVIVQLEFSSMEVADRVVSAYNYYGWNANLVIDDSDNAGESTCCYIELISIKRTINNDPL